MPTSRLQTAVSVAEIVSALAIVVSVLYAANEFRRSRTLTSTDVQTILYERMLEMDRLLVEAADLAGIVIRASTEPEDLAPAERTRFLAYEHIFYDTWELAWTARNEGVLDEDGWAEWESWFTAEAERRPAVGWRGNQQNLGDDFVRFVEERLSVRGDEPPP